jgi:hypothetical protein
MSFTIGKAIDIQYNGNGAENLSKNIILVYDTKGKLIARTFVTLHLAY